MDQGSLEQIEALYRARYGDFLRVATAIVGDLESGRDVVHDAFVRAVHSIATYDASGELDAWLFRILIKTAITARRRVRPSVDWDEDSLAGTERSDDGYEDLRRAVAMLPERQRVIVFLRYYADLDYAAIADALDIEPGTVGAQLHAARHSLLAVIQEVTAHD